MDIELVKTVGLRLAALFFALLTAAHLAVAFNVSTFVIGVLLVLFFAPSLRDWMFSRGVPRPPLKYAALAVAIAVAGQFGFTIARLNQDAQERADAEAAKAHLAEQVEHAKQEERGRYLAHKQEQLAGITRRSENGQFAEARAQVARLQSLISDPDLEAELKVIDLAEARRMKDDEALPLETRVKYYKMVVGAEPGNASLRAKAMALDTQLLAQQAEQKRQQAAVLRKQFIERQFSQWNGAHMELERAIKDTMKNPDSYEHVSTRYIDKGNSIIVLTKFRGTNSFGAIVPSVVRAEIDDSGRIKSMETLE
jgi:hypothetical protein